MCSSLADTGGEVRRKCWRMTSAARMRFRPRSRFCRRETRHRLPGPPRWELRADDAACSRAAVDPILLDVGAQWKEPAERDDPSGGPAIRETEIVDTITIPNGQCTVLVTAKTDESDDRLHVLLVGPIDRIKPISLSPGTADPAQGQTTAADREDAPDWAKAPLTALPGRQIELSDAAPSVFVRRQEGPASDHQKRKKNIWTGSETTWPAFTRVTAQAGFVMRYQRVEIVVFPGGELPAGAQARIGWAQWQDEWPSFKKAVHMGRGMGMDWYANATIYDQERLRQSLKLEGGDDRLALLTEAMLVQDEGAMTRNSCVHLLAAEGDKAIPYIQAAVEGRENGAQAIHALAFIQTDAATEYLNQLYQAEPTRAFAEYALIHEPFRQDAKEQYLDMLQRRRYVVETAKACVQFGWKDATPLMNAEYDGRISMRIRDCLPRRADPGGPARPGSHRSAQER